MSSDFDIDTELARNDAQEITDDTLATNHKYFVTRVLEGLEAPILTPEKRVGSLLEMAISTGTVAISDPVPEGTYYGNPTMDFLRKLPQEYYGKQVELPTNYGFKVPFSLARVEGKLYIRIHMSESGFKKSVDKPHQGSTK